MNFDWLKRLAGIDPEQETIEELFRHDQGPAKARYLRRLFPQSVFTQKITPARRQTIRDVLRRLRPEQRAIVYRRGWNKGVTV